MTQGQLALDVGESVWPFVAPLDAFCDLQRLAQHFAERRRICDPQRRPALDHTLSIRPQQRDVDAVHGRAAHQPDRGFHLTHVMDLIRNIHR